MKFGSKKAKMVWNTITVIAVIAMLAFLIVPYYI